MILLYCHETSQSMSNLSLFRLCECCCICLLSITVCQLWIAAKINQSWTAALYVSSMVYTTVHTAVKCQTVKIKPCRIGCDGKGVEWGFGARLVGMYRSTDLLLREVIELYPDLLLWRGEHDDGDGVKADRAGRLVELKTRAGHINALFLRELINSLSPTIICLPLMQFLSFIIFIVNVCCSLSFILKKSIVGEPSKLLTAAALTRKQSEKKRMADEAG